MSVATAVRPATELAAPAADAVAPLLRTIDIRKSFGGVHAVDGVDFTVVPGEIHATRG